METNEKPNYVADAISSLRAYGEICREREKIMLDRDLPHAAEVSCAVAEAITFACRCFEDVIDSSNPERQQAVVKAIKDAIAAQAVDNAAFAESVSTNWFTRMFGI